MNRRDRRRDAALGRRRVEIGRVTIGTPGPDGIALDPTGDRLMVIRPAQPKLALAIATVALEKNDKGLFDRLPDEVGDYTFVGWLSSHGTPQYIVDEQGQKTGDLQPGDSFVTLRDRETS